MKVFWAIIGLLLAATVGLFLFRNAPAPAPREGSDAAAPAVVVGDNPGPVEARRVPPASAEEEPVDDVAAASPAVAPSSTEVEPDASDAPVVRAPDASLVGEPVVGDDEAEAGSAPAAVVASDALEATEPPLTPETAGAALDLTLGLGAGTPVEKEETAEGETAPVATEIAEADEASEPDGEATAEEGSALVDRSADQPETIATTTAGTSPPTHQPGHQPAPAAPDMPEADLTVEATQTVERQDDGRIVIAGKYVVTGSGTKADPYEVPWDLILTARDTYRPRLGRKEIPTGLEMLNGSYLRVRGYMLLPLMGTDIRELLLMRNQWDGCCIGVPPTPYDAIEVKLNDVPTMLSRFRVNFGSVTGKFNIDPYERKDWLLSLYTMEDAEIAVTGF